MAQRQCEFCQGELNQGMRFCSKKCYQLFLVENPPKGKVFNKGHIPWNKWLKGRRPYMNLSGLNGVEKHSEETKQKMRLKATGRRHTEETRKKISMLQRNIKKEYWNEMIKNGYEMITPKDKLERHRFRNEIQKQVFKRDNYTCQLCGQKGGKLQVDHIQSWADYIELRFCIDNCRTLCMACHYKITFGKPMPPTVRAWGHNFSRRVLQ